MRSTGIDYLLRRWLSQEIAQESAGDQQGPRKCPALGAAALSGSMISIDRHELRFGFHQNRIRSSLTAS